MALTQSLSVPTLGVPVLPELYAVISKLASFMKTFCIQPGQPVSLHSSPGGSGPHSFPFLTAVTTQTVASIPTPPTPLWLITFTSASPGADTSISFGSGPNPNPHTDLSSGPVSPICQGLTVPHRPVLGFFLTELGQETLDLHLAGFQVVSGTPREFTFWWIGVRRPPVTEVFTAARNRL
ncbi:hypothetical protein PAL_GLEAN10018205 [Pteropus alecto]|uniref:Uncharacterized protein n=1 Tax=Pteropus alecto TaxID=9402 RepID=L5JPS9_PTEAL|nr:hypothetical protein PAL_GLEAN10018205 [Pteropus alecto]